MDTWENHCASSFAGGNGTEANPYRIETAEQLAYFAKQSQSYSFQGSYIVLENSIDMSQYIWEGIGINTTSSVCYFEGNFNGAFNTILGINMMYNLNISSDSVGFFNAIGNASITNLILSNANCYYTNSSVKFGFITGVCAGTSSISGCIVENSYLSMPNLTGSGYVGGIVGNMLTSDSKITACLVRNCSIYLSNETATTTNYIGGIVGGGSSGIVLDCGVYNFFANCSARRIMTYPISPNRTNIMSSYSYFKIINLLSREQDMKYMWGTNDDFGRWYFNSSLNYGYPIQMALFTIAPAVSQTSSQVYNYLVSLGFSE